MRRTEQLKLFDSSKSVVVAIDNKLPSLDASNLYNLPNSSLGGLLFKAPKIDSETITYNLYIEFSADGTFATTTTYNTTDASHRNLFKVFSGQQLTDFPESGISLPFSNEVVSFDITELNKELKYFRFRWNNGSDFGGYGFGKTDSLLQIFDSGSSLDKVSVGIGLSGDGSESNPLNVDLSSYETTAGISIQGLNIDLISDGNFDIKGTALNIGDNTTNIPIVLNGHTQNSASGLVVLGEDGKLPALDGSKLTNVSSIISVSSGLVGNGTTANPIKLDLSSYSTTDKINIISAGFDLNAGNNNIDFTISEGSNRFRILVGDQAGSYNQECMFDVSQPQILLNAMGESVIDLKVPSINKLRLSIADRGSECVPNTANGFVIVDQDGKLPALDGSKLTNLPAGGLTTVTVSSGLSGSGTSSDPIKLDLSNYNSGSNIILNPGSNMITLGSSNSAVKLLVSGKDRLYLQQGDGTQSACNTANGLVVLDSNGKIPESILPEISVGETDISSYTGGVNIVNNTTTDTIIKGGSSSGNVHIGKDSTAMGGTSGVAGLNITGERKEVSLNFYDEGTASPNDIQEFRLGFSGSVLTTHSFAVKNGYNETSFSISQSDNISINFNSGQFDVVSGSVSVSGDTVILGTHRTFAIASITEGTDEYNIHFGYGLHEIGEQYPESGLFINDLEVIHITAPTITFNNNAQNTAGGLVVLGTDGKIPTNLYDSGSSGSSLTKLSFKVPEIPSSEVYHFAIEFSSTLDFASTTIFKTNVTDDLTKFKVSTGIEITDFPSSGLGVAFIGETVFFDFSSVNESLKYFRYRWSDSGNNYSGYGFGQTDSLLQIFGTEEGSGSASIVVGNGLTGEGNTANPLKVELSNYQGNTKLTSALEGKHEIIAESGNPAYTSKLTVSTANISLDSDDIVIDGQASVNVNSGNKVTISCTNTTEISGNIVDITTTNLRLNSASQNTAGGFVILTSDGKLPAVDGSQLTNLPTGGLASVSVGSGLTGNGTSNSPLNIDLSNFNQNNIKLLSQNDGYIYLEAHSPTVNSTSFIQITGMDGTESADGEIYMSSKHIYLTGSDLLSIHTSKLYFNNNNVNTAGGLVVLGEDGKIPESLYNAGSSSEITEVKPLLIELNGSNSTSDGITVTYDNENHIVTIIHNLNSYVNGILFDEYGKQALLGIDFVDLNTVSIQFTSQIMPTSESVWKLYLGTQNYNYVYSNAVQTKTISTKDIVFDPNKSIYVIDVTENTLITFDESNLNIDENIYTFEIWVKMTKAYTIGFSGDIEWLDKPDLTAGGFYCFVVRFMPTSYYPMSLGNRDAIMSLSYHI